MNLHGIEIQSRRTFGGTRKRLTNVSQAVSIQRYRRMLIGLKWQPRGGDGLPATRLVRTDLLAAFLPGHTGRGFASCMCKLDPDRHIGITAHRTKDAAERSFIFIGPKPKVARTDTPFGR